jgi:hypothetical protein
MPDLDLNTTTPAPSFGADIKPLFRAKDRAAMLKSFDLWSAADVATYGSQIAGQLQAGTMPCDGAWPQNHVQLLVDWLNGGTPP